MDEKELIIKTAGWLRDKWGVNLPQDPSAFDERTELLLFLKPRLAYLVDHEFEYLVNMMYRLDISEAKFHSAMGSGSPAKIAERLAQLVLDREFQRMETRIRYSQSQAEEE